MPRKKKDYIARNIIVRELFGVAKEKFPEGRHQPNLGQIDFIIKEYHKLLMEYMCLGIPVKTPLGTLEGVVQPAQEKYNNLHGRPYTIPSKMVPKMRWSKTIKDLMIELTPYRISEDRASEVALLRVELSKLAYLDE